MAVTGGSFIRSTGSADPVGRTNVEGRTPAQVVTDLATPLNAAYTQRANDLSDLASAPTARTNLGLGSMALESAASFQPADPNLTTISGIVIGTVGLDMLQAATKSVAVDLVAPPVVVLTTGANVATDATGARVFSLLIENNATLDNPTNLIAGQTYKWIITQDAPAGHTMAYGSMFKWPGGTVPTISTGPNEVDVITALYDGTDLFATMAQDFS